MTKSLLLALSLLLPSAGSSLAQVHAHLNIGAVSRETGSKLAFDNGGDFTAESGYVKTLWPATSGALEGLYEGNITLTALHSIDPFGDPVPGGALPGTFVAVEIVSALGPEGSEFQFWETNSTASPALSLPAGSTNSTFRFDVSQAALGAGEPGGDPFGHIHGRRFTATLPGIYTVSFRAVDLSTNGPGGGPLHAPSDLIAVRFQAGVNIANVERTESGTRVVIGAPQGYFWQLQSSESLSGSDWKNAGSAFPGSDSFAEIIDEDAAGPHRFYRALGQPVVE